MCIYERITLRKLRKVLAALGLRHQIRCFQRFILLLIHRFPSCGLHDISMGSKPLTAALRDDRCLFIFIRRIQHRKKSPHHKIIDPSLVDRHMGEIHELFRRDDRMMVRDLRIIYKSRSCLDFLVKQGS